MKEKDMVKLLFEMLKNSRRSDRELAKVLGVSQPTVTRTRQRLEKEYIRSYTLFPLFDKIGYGIIAFTFFKSKSYEKRALPVVALRYSAPCPIARAGVFSYNVSALGLF